MRRALVLVPAIVALVACAEGSGGSGEPASGVRRAKRTAVAICTSTPLPAGPGDGGVSVDASLPGDDAGPGSDASLPDASLPDAGPGSDASLPDASLPDAGPGSDASLPDASLPDAGPGSDASLPDASLPDAGTGSDASFPDAGLPDAGTGSDGGMGSDGGPPGDGGMDCKGLDIVEATIPLVPMGTGTAEVRSVVGFTDQMVGATITGDGFVFTTPGCSPQQCNFAAMPKALPFVLTIACNATDGMPHAGTLRAQGAQGPSDFDTASLSCAGSANMPLISVAPAAIDAGDVPVGTPSSHMFAVTNNGTATLTFSILLPAGAPAWTAPGSPCIAPAQCSVAPGGGVSLVGLRFLPAAHGVSAGTIQITSNAGARSVDVTGTGLGARIVVTDPSDGDLDFGTIPRGTTTNRPIAVTAIGNAPVSVTAATSGAPFSVAPAAPAALVLQPGESRTFTASCGAPTATGPVDGAITLDSADAYALDLGSIAVHCEVANTVVSVVPNELDFDEVRRDTPAPVLPFTISNPGALAATITSVELAGAPAALSIAVDGGGFPRALPAGGTIGGRLTLSTGEDLDLAKSGPTLRIAVDGEQLVYPVTGKVTTPAAYVTPEKLELGTACLGSGATAVVSMINSGTARLTMEAPEVDPTFELDLQSPPSYPAPLLAGTAATIGIAPVNERPGEVSGTLTWAVDAPRSPFTIPVSLAFIENGTAISPASLNFSTVKVKEMSLRYMVTLENCSAAPVVVSVEGVISSRGGIAAWKVEPNHDERTLAPRDKLTISVAFAPQRHGRHVAQLQLGVDGERRTVTLEGDAIDLDFERTSFYACGCTTPRAGGGAPIALAIALVVLRPRRRRRATAR